MKRKNIFEPFTSESKDLKVSGFGTPHWSEDQFLTQPLKEISTNTLVTTQQLKILFFLIFLGLGILWLKISYLQIAKGSNFRQQAETIRVDINPIKANRGVIFDQQKNLLVQNLARFNLTLIPAYLPKKESERDNLFNKIVEITKQDKNTILEILKTINVKSSTAYQPIIISQNLDSDQALPLIIASSNWPGINLELTSQREYLNPQMSQILGYLGMVTEENVVKQNYLVNDLIGKTGLEYSYEDWLKGETGKKRVEVDSLGKEINILNQELAKTGANLILTIDSNLQNYLYQSLQRVINKTTIFAAIGIILNPNSGEILAMVSLPDYDNNIFVRNLSPSEFEKIINDPNKPLFNRAISGEYPPGSSIKPIIAAAALEDKIIDQNFTVLSTGGLTINQWFFPDWKKGGHGQTDLMKALAESVNTYFYLIGGGDNQSFTGLGLERINYYAQLFGLEQKLGIDLPGEATGFLPTKEWKEKTKNEQWYIGDTYHLAIGQGDILVTPLQVASYTSVFANQGTLYKPFLVKEIRTPDDQTVNLFSPTILRQNFISPKNLQLVKKGLRQAVINGSAKKLNNLSVTVAGKTGTAQSVADRLPHAWFTCFAPYEEPEIVLTILLEEGGEGSDLPVDLANDFLNWYFTIYKK